MTFFSVLKCQFHKTLLHENMYLEITPRKWFRNCSLILRCTSKVDGRRLGMSLVILKTVVVARIMNHYEYCEFVCGLPYHVFRTQLFIKGVVVGKAYLQSNTTLLSIS